MKTTCILLGAACITAQAALIPFDISPAGTDAAVGLSPTNEVPIVENSLGSGNEISGGVLFDSDTHQLHIAIGYGSSAGFTDLTGAAQSMHIHGPAAAGANTNVLVDLWPFHFPATDPTKGGVIYGTIPFPADSVSNLLAGFTYINIHTPQNPAGEIRGQLIVVAATNSPPEVACPEPAIIECGESASVTVVVSDPDGDALTVVWTVNGTPMQTNTVPASDPPAAANVQFSALLPLGTNTVAVTVTDAPDSTASCGATVIVLDTLPPVITAAKAKPNILWPPNHKMVPIKLSALVTDQCGPTTWKVVKVWSNESKDGLGDGQTAEDWIIDGDHSVQLRAERSGKGNGRLYYIQIQAEDASGNLSETRTVNVLVPKSQGASAPKSPAPKPSAPAKGNAKGKGK